MSEVLDGFIEEGLEEREKAFDEAFNFLKEAGTERNNIEREIDEANRQNEYFRNQRVQLEGFVEVLLDEYGTLANLQDLIPEHRQSIWDLLQSTNIDKEDLTKWKDALGVGDTPGGVADIDLVEGLDSILEIEQIEIFVPSEENLQLAIDRETNADKALTAAEESLLTFSSNPVAALEATGVVTANMLPRSERGRFNAEVEKGFETPVPPSAPSARAVSSIDVDNKRQRAAELRNRQPADPEAEAKRILTEARVQRRADANAAAREGQRVEGGTMDPGQRRETEIDASSTGVPTPPSAKAAAETAKANQPIDASSTGIPDPPSAKAAAETARAAQLSSMETPENNVLALQQALIAKGFDPGEPDGVWGSQTAAAVRAFQESAGLSVDGVVGANTAAALGVDPVAESFSRSGTGGTGETTGGAVETTGTFGDEDIRDIAAQNGYGARWFAHPEIGPILTKAVNEGWFDSDTGIRRLEAEIRQTDWYQTHTAASREFEVLEGNDPATAGELISDQVLRIERAAKRVGLTLSTERMREMGRDAHIEKWSEYELNQFVILEAEWETGFAGGAVEDNYSVIDKLAGDYMVGHLIDDETRDEWATALYLGDETQAGITNDIAALAESAFPSLTARIQQGYTARQILAPLSMEVSRLLPDVGVVDFMTDSRFQPIIHHVQEDGSERIMTVAEVGKYVRGLEDWQTTDAAKSSAQEFADFIGKKFGSVA